MSDQPAVSPVRIIKEAERLLELLPTTYLDVNGEEELQNNLTELEDLRERLYKAGITYIHADGRHNGSKDKCNG